MPQAGLRMWRSVVSLPIGGSHGGSRKKILSEGRRMDGECVSEVTTKNTDDKLTVSQA